MPRVIEPGYCCRCEEGHEVGRHPVNHRLHLILTLFTIGIWSVVWAFFATLGPKLWQCEKCGSFDVLLS